MLSDVASQGPTADAIYHQLYADHAGAVLQYLTNKLRDPDTAQDVAQDAWIKAHRGLPAVLGRGDAASKAWVMRIATNAMTDHWRAAKARPKTSDLEAALAPIPALLERLLDRETPEHVSLAAEHQEEAARNAAVVLELLPRLERYLLWLYEWRGYSYERLAMGLGMTVPAIKSRLHRAREAQRLVWERDMAQGTRRESVQLRIWRPIAGGRDWALSHQDECWPWLGTLVGRRYPGISVVTHHPVVAGDRRGVPHRTIIAVRLLYALRRGLLPPWACLSPCQHSGRCVNPFHATVVSKRSGSTVGSACYRQSDPASDRPAGALSDARGAWPTGAELRRRREALGVGPRQLAESIGVHRTTVRNAECGRLVLPEVLRLIVGALIRFEATLSPVTITTGAALREWRVAAGMTMLALAQRSGVNRMSLWNFEAGVGGLSWRSLRRLQDYFDRLERERQETAA